MEDMSNAAGGNEKPCGACRGRGRWTWGGGGGALEGLGGGLGSKSGASERLGRVCRVGGVSAGGGCAVRGGSRCAAVGRTGPRRGTSRASQEVSAGLEGPRVVPPGTWVKASSRLPGPWTSPFPARHYWSGRCSVVRSQGLPD